MSQGFEQVTPRRADLVAVAQSAFRSPMFTRIALASAVAAILWRLRAFLPPHTLPARGDPSLLFQGSDLTPQWVPWLRVAIDSLWHHASLAFWNPFTNGGAPLFEVPEAGLLSLATILGAVLPIEAAVKWAMLAHVVAGMLGTHALARRLGVAGPFAAVGAFSFGTGTYLLDHFRVGHLSHVQPMCLAPWAMLLLLKAIDTRETWWRSAAGAGVILGLEVLEGGTSVFLYTMLAFSLLIVTVVEPGFRASISRLLRVGAVAVACLLTTAAPQLLPMLSYIGLTARSSGLTLAQSSDVIHEVANPFPTTAAIAVMCVGVGFLLGRRSERRAAIWLAAVVTLGLAAASLPAVYGLLWRYVPGFQYQRNPERALVLVGIAGPPLIAAGMEGTWRAVARWRSAGVLAYGLVLAAFCYQLARLTPGTPPMADPSAEQTENHAMRWLAEHAEGSRIHIWESPSRQWGANNITVPLGLEAITSYTPSEHHDYLPGDFDEPTHRTFLGDSYSNPARFWGMLNVRYVTSMVPRSEPGFRLAAEVERCPVEICQPAKSAGPYIYENKKWLPRGWVVQHAFVIVAPAGMGFDATLDILRMPTFDPARTAILQISAGEAIPAPVDGVFSVGVDVPNAVPLGSDEAEEKLSSLLERGTDDLRPAAFARRDNNHVEFRASSDGWLVASEKLSLYPGWAASVDGKSARIVRADGVLGAIHVANGTTVRLTYEPRGFRIGVALLASMLVVVAATGLWRRRAHQMAGSQ